MTWVRNPFFKAQQPSTSHLPDSSDAEAGVGVIPAPGADSEAPEAPDAPLPDEPEPGLAILRPTAKMTAHQFFYIFILDGLGAFVLSGGINFAIAYAMYTTQDIEKHPIRLFQLPNTLAGDAAVTIIIQCIITWLVELILVNRDIRGGHVAPIGFIAQPSSRLARWFLLLDRKPRVADGSVAHYALFVYSQVLRGFLTAFPSFCLLWGPSVGILTAVGTRSGGDWVFHKTWAPQVFKLLLGGVLGLVTTPFFAMFWLVRAGWALQTNSGVPPGGS